MTLADKHFVVNSGGRIEWTECIAQMKLNIKMNDKKKKWENTVEKTVLENRN
jgi:hypothetical protein